ncbi:hypothetical protein K457DRAFT_17078 [Linnemannia elongata AG-77]|uniref:Uncharacterized protein n=1 Tax=Linnemannia elongata AG-77 TaxID=1314771 RepID=A0A197K501_9FUNG|nr:hypothetical protein K457DRAFT_17078 [Linnemannia elongata AG-77]
MSPGFESICFVGPDVSSSFSFCLLSVIICVANFLNLGTVGFMIKRCRQTHPARSVTYTPASTTATPLETTTAITTPVNAASKPPATSPNFSNNNGALPVAQMKAFQYRAITR